MLETEFGKSKEINEQKRKAQEALEAAEREVENDSGEDSAAEETEEPTIPEAGNGKGKEKRKFEEGGKESSGSSKRPRHRHRQTGKPGNKNQKKN